MLTDGLAGAEDRMIGIVGLYQKSVRERCFPLHLLEKGLKVKIEDACCKEPNMFVMLRVNHKRFTVQGPYLAGL